MPAPSWERGTSGPFEGLLRGNHDLAVEHEGRDEEQPEGRVWSREYREVFRREAVRTTWKGTM